MHDLHTKSDGNTNTAHVCNRQSWCMWEVGVRTTMKSCTVNNTLVWISYTVVNFIIMWLVISWNQKGHNKLDCDRLCIAVSVYESWFLLYRLKATCLCLHKSTCILRLLARLSAINCAGDKATVYTSLLHYSLYHYNKAVVHSVCVYAVSLLWIAAESTYETTQFWLWLL